MMINFNYGCGWVKIKLTWNLFHEWAERWGMKLESHPHSLVLLTKENQNHKAPSNRETDSNPRSTVQTPKTRYAAKPFCVISAADHLDGAPFRGAVLCSVRADTGTST